MGLPDPCLCLDGSVRGRLRVGVLSRAGWVAAATGADDVAECIQPCVEQALRAAGLRLADISAFAVNLGPGSILGIRASILSARAWSEVTGKPMLGWSGHRAAAHAAQGSCDAVVSEGRAGMLNVQRLDDTGPVGELAELPPGALAALRVRPLHGGFRNATPPGMGEPVDAWNELPALFSSHGLLSQPDRFDALNTAATYALWSGQRHQGGTP